MLVAAVIVIDAFFIYFNTKKNDAAGSTLRYLNITATWSNFDSELGIHVDPELAEKLLKTRTPIKDHPTSTLLLYSTENDATTSAIENFKQEFRRRFPHCRVKSN